MTEDDPTKDLTDRQILLELRHAVGSLVERVTALEHRTNPLPPNYDARFTAMEQSLAEFRAETGARFDALEKSVRLTNHKLDKLALDLLETHAQQQELTARVDVLESRPN